MAQKYNSFFFSVDGCQIGTVSETTAEQYENVMSTASKPLKRGESYLLHNVEKSLDNLAN